MNEIAKTEATATGNAAGETLVIPREGELQAASEVAARTNKVAMIEPTATAIVTATVIATAKVGSATVMAARHAIENASARATEVFAARVDVRRPG